MNGAERTAQRMLSWLVDSQDVTQEKIRRRLKLLTAGAIGMLILSGILGASLQHRRDQNTIRDAAQLIEHQTCAERNGRTLIVCIDEHHWNAAAPAVRGAWELGEFYLNPTIDRLVAKNVQGTHILAVFEATSDMPRKRVP